MKKKKKIKGIKFLWSDEGRETSLSSSSLFLPFLPLLFTARVVSHSAIEQRCTVASGLARPLSARILEEIGGDTAQIG